jgi:hypothetical protein
MSAHNTWCSGVSTNILAWACSIVLWGACLYYTMVFELTKVYMNDTCHYYPQENLPLAYRNVNTWHLPLLHSEKYLPLAYWNATLSFAIPQRATLNVIMWTTFHLKKLLMLTNGIISKINICDTLRPPSISSLGPSPKIVYVTLNSMNGVVLYAKYYHSSYPCHECRMLRSGRTCN